MLPIGENTEEDKGVEAHESVDPQAEPEADSKEADTTGADTTGASAEAKQAPTKGMIVCSLEDVSNNLLICVVWCTTFPLYRTDLPSPVTCPVV